MFELKPEEYQEPTMPFSGGRVFKVADRASTKALRQQHAWDTQRMAKGQWVWNTPKLFFMVVQIEPRALHTKHTLHTGHVPSPRCPPKDSTSVCSGPSAVAFISYASLGNILNATFFEEADEKDPLYLNSQVVSAAVAPRRTASLSQSVALTFQHLKVGGSCNCPR